MTTDHDWPKDPLGDAVLPSTWASWPAPAQDALKTWTKCENCASVLLWYDNQWWHLIYWDAHMSKWQHHSPERCRDARAQRNRLNAEEQDNQR